MRSMGWLLALVVVAGLVGFASAAVIYVPEDYSTIQAAINAANDDDIIVVAAGIYREQLKIDGEDLTIQGAGIGSTIVEAVDIGSRTAYSITQWTGASRTIDACIGVVGPCDVTIEDLTVDGRSLGPNNFYGIHIFNADATVTDCRIEDILYAAGPGESRVVSLAATHGTGTASYAVEFTGNQIPNLQKGGILVMGPKISFVVEDNVVSDTPSGSIAGNGIQLSYGASGVTSGNEVSGVAYTGGFWGATGILLFESGDVFMTGDVVHDCEMGVNYSNWHWIYSAPGMVAVSLDGAELYDNKWAAGAHLAADNADLEFTADGCYFYDNVYDGIDLYGTGAYSGYYAGWSNGDLVAEITDCLFTGSGYDGIWTDDSSGNTSNTATIDVHRCAFVGNSEAGIWNTLTHTIDAENCWWNDPAGPTVLRGGTDSRPAAPDASPYGDTLPEQGVPRVTESSVGRAGDGVRGPVDASPYFVGNVICDPDPLTLKVGATTGQVAVKYLGGGGGLVFAYSVTVSWDAAKVSLTGVTEGGLLKDAAPTAFQVYGTGNTRTIDCSTLGQNNPGVTGPGTMFTLNFSAVGYGESPVDVTLVAFRNNANAALPGFLEDDGLIKVDITNPSVTNVHIANLTLAHTDDHAKNTDNLQLTATVTDVDYVLTAADITADLSALLVGGGTAVPAESYNSGTGLATWTTALANVTLTADGSRSVTVTAKDGLGNIGTGSDAIIVDNTKPTVVTDFNASPGHNKCDLVWAMGTDTYLAGVTVRRTTVPGDYPTYGSFKAAWPTNTAQALYPANHTAGVGVYNGTGTSAADADTARTIHYYQAFCYDQARNYGEAAVWPSVSSRDLATNYWLGDVAKTNDNWGFDGWVTVNDINKLAGQYGTTGPWANYFNRCDVGPTVHPNNHRLGVPFPSNTIQFEDLMIFAMNYGAVAPRVVPFLPEPAGEALALSLAEVSGSAAGEVVVALRLDGNVGDVKGVSAAVTYDPSQLEFVSARLSAGMASPLGEMFFWSGTRDNRVRVDLAVLGTGVTIGGSGDVAELVFRALGGEYALGFGEALLRGVENEELTVVLRGLESRPEVPTVFRLAQNAPNPFNPRTTVVYEVPQASEVTIRVYDVTGRLVRTLVDGTVSPGRYAVAWDGTSERGESVGSGVYFCVMETPEYHATHKMMLLK